MGRPDAQPDRARGVDSSPPLRERGGVEAREVEQSPKVVVIEQGWERQAVEGCPRTGDWNGGGAEKAQHMVAGVNPKVLKRFDSSYEKYDHTIYPSVCEPSDI